MLEDGLIWYGRGCAATVVLIGMPTVSIDVESCYGVLIGRVMSVRVAVVDLLQRMP